MCYEGFSANQLLALIDRRLKFTFISAAIFSCLLTRRPESNSSVILVKFSIGTLPPINCDFQLSWFVPTFLPSFKYFSIDYRPSTPSCNWQIKYFNQKVQYQDCRSCRHSFTSTVIKARMENEIMRNGLHGLRVRVLRTYKEGKVQVNRRQLLEKRGQEITCSCSNLKPNKVYVILGKEDKRKRVLYIDNFSTALEWSKNGKAHLRAYRKKSSCPARRS